MYNTEINTDVVHWLNQKTKSSNHRVVLLDGFIFMLTKIKLQGSVRLVKENYFHQRFWKSLDKTLNYNLYRKKKKVTVHLYDFYFAVSVSEGFLLIEDGKAKITNKGFEFLHLSSEEQLSFLLSKIW